ncbi:MAG: holo-ACP synthase [Cyclobacteriaceae bacterium]|nr:holo-ACP synthase [Cyclobacteriaceae bacterium]
MIIGTGIDIIEVSRVADKIAKGNGFLEKIFSPDEIAFCEQKKDKDEHYAARFAAKEAFLKAIGLGLSAGFDLCNIELFNDESGKPHLRLKGPFEQLAREKQWQAVHVSLSHIQSTACATVIIEG